MIAIIPDSDHILLKKLNGQQEQRQQQQWQRVFKSNKKKPTNNKFTSLLDKHFVNHNYNYFAPLSLPSNPFPSISSPFPTIMPTLKSKLVMAPALPNANATTVSTPKPTKQSNIDAFYKKSHANKDSGKTSGSDEGSIKPTSKAKASSPSKLKETVKDTDDFTMVKDHTDSDHKEVLTRSSKRISNRRSIIESDGNESDNADDSDFGKEEWDMPEANLSDTSDSDVKIAKVINRVSGKGHYRKGGHGGRHGNRDRRRGDNRGRGGGLASDCESDFSQPKKSKSDGSNSDDYTDEEVGVVPVAIGAKRRKSMAHHRKRRDKIMDDVDDDNTDADADNNKTKNDADVDADMDQAPNEAVENTLHSEDNIEDDAEPPDNDDDDEPTDADSDIMGGNEQDDQAESDADDNPEDTSEPGDRDESENGDNSDEELGDSELQITSSIPTFDTKWLFEFHPTEKVGRFTVDSIIGCLATAIRSVDATAYIAAWDDDTPEKIYSQATVPKTDEDMKFFVEDPHTSSAGANGRFYGRIRVLSSMTLVEMKLNPEFGAWIRSQGLFLDTSEIPSTRPKLVGFFDRKLPHTSRIAIFKSYLKSIASISRPFQLFSQTINAGDKTDLKCYAYVLKADSQDCATILKELACFKKNGSVKFYPWEDFRDHTDLVDKRKIITDMTAYARNHASFVFRGVKSNDYMRIKNDKRSKNQKTNNDKQLSSLQQAFMDEENQKDDAFSNLKCLDYMKQVFVDSDRQPIFKRIDGPYQEQIEVTFEKAYFNKVRDIEKRFIPILASKMTETSCSKCFTTWPLPLTPDSMTALWLPPKAFKTTSNNSTNLYKKSNIEYSLTSKSNMSYKDASTSGRRQIDIPMTLVVKDQITSTTDLTATTSKSTTLTHTKESALLAELKTTQHSHQIEYDARMAKLDATIARVEAESKRLQESLAALSIEVTTKYKEIKVSQRKSEQRITKALEKQTTFQKKDAARNKLMMAKILKKLGGDDTDQEESDDEDETDNDDDTIMKQETQNHGSSRTNHPKEKNTKHIRPSSRNKKVAAVVN